MDKDVEATVKQYMCDGLDIGKWTCGGKIDCADMTKETADNLDLSDVYLDDMFWIAREVTAEYGAWMRSNVGGA